MSGIVDLAVWENRLYALDKASGKVLAFDSDGRLAAQLGADWGLNAPEGLTVTDGFLYVADTGNSRILKADMSGEVQAILPEPDPADTLSSVPYEPIQIAVNASGQLFVIARNNSNGILQMDKNGEFMGYFGSVPVVPNTLELFWRRFSTKEQLTRMLLFIPTEYNSMVMDESGYLYVTVSSIEERDLQSYLQGGGNDAQAAPVRRLNAKGSDILRRQGFVKPGGDVPETGEAPSRLSDVTVRENAMYSILDRTHNRIFTYDGDGQLLYVFGGGDGTADALKAPSAICWWGDRMAVADNGGNGCIKIYAPTEYASVLTEGVQAYQEGQYDRAARLWERVEELHAGSDLAKIYIGREYMRQGDYERAKACFRAANNTAYYSDAFEMQRRQAGSAVILYVFAGLAALVTAGLLTKWLVKKHKPAAAAPSPLRGLGQNVGFAFHLMRHPFSGFWELKFEHRGNPLVAAGILIATVILNLVSYRATGYLVAGNSQNYVNLFITGILGIVLPAGLWCLANWSVTALMNGTGTMRDILIYTGYSLLPLTLGLPVLILLSHVLSLHEMALYNMAQAVIYGYMFFLLFVGTLVTHQYMVLKTLVAVLVSILAMAILVFLCLLGFTLVQQIVEFLVRLIEEIVMRS